MYYGYTDRGKTKLLVSSGRNMYLLKCRTPVCFGCQNMDYLKWIIWNEHILDRSPKSKGSVIRERRWRARSYTHHHYQAQQSSCHLSSSVWQRVPQKTTSSVGECLHLPESWAQIWHACCELGWVLNYLIWWVPFNIFRLIIYCKSECVQNVFIV